jgi:RimJ/RimL family protein N-acetyltransferase
LLATKQSLNAMARGISLRQFKREDADAVHRWFNSPAATANLLEHRDEFSEEDARRWVERAIEQAGDPDSEDRKWAIEVEGIDEAVGYTALYGLGRQTAPELGTIVGDERVSGKGVGREAERLTNLKAFEEFGAHKVYGRIPATNEAAKKAVIYNGWKQEGVLRNHVRHGGELIDVELWGGFREDLPEPPED